MFKTPEARPNNLTTLIPHHTPDLPSTKRERLFVEMVGTGIAANQAKKNVGIFAEWYDDHGKAHSKDDSLNMSYMAMLIRARGVRSILAFMEESKIGNPDAIRAHLASIESEILELTRYTKLINEEIKDSDALLFPEDQGHQNE